MWWVLGIIAVIGIPLLIFLIATEHDPCEKYCESCKKKVWIGLYYDNRRKTCPICRWHFEKKYHYGSKGDKK